MMTRPLGIAPLVFGGNVFGWTIDENQFFFLSLSLTTVLTLSIRRMFIPAGRRATGRRI